MGNEAGIRASRLVRALDLRRAAAVTLEVLPVRMAPPVAPAVRAMSIEAALHWAFAVEHADLDLDNRPEWHVGTDMIWHLMRTQALGCRVDGGGRSRAHPDAEVIASFVAALPVARGGRSMAAQVAALARAGLRPDWRCGDRRCVPQRLRHANQHGPRAATEWTSGYGETGWGVPVQVCPVTYVPGVSQIMAARRGWLDWWGALHDLGTSLRAAGRLETVAITGAMPVHQPWATGA